MLSFYRRGIDQSYYYEVFEPLIQPLHKFIYTE